MFSGHGGIHCGLLVDIIGDGDGDCLDLLHLQHLAVIIKSVGNAALLGECLCALQSSHRNDLCLLDIVLEGIGMQIADKPGPDQTYLDSSTHTVLLFLIKILFISLNPIYPCSSVVNCAFTDAGPAGGRIWRSISIT